MSDDAWLCDAAYAYLDDLSPADLSWEFVRRHPEYQRVFVEMSEQETSSAAPLTGIGQGRDWGLVFRRRSRSQRPAAARLLAA